LRIITFTIIIILFLLLRIFFQREKIEQNYKISYFSRTFAWIDTNLTKYPVQYICYVIIWPRLWPLLLRRTTLERPLIVTRKPFFRRLEIPVSQCDILPTGISNIILNTASLLCVAHLTSYAKTFFFFRLEPRFGIQNYANDAATIDFRLIRDPRVIRHLGK